MVSLPAFMRGNLRTAQERTIVEDSRAADALWRISLKSYDAVFMTTAGVWLAAQTVRLESDNSASSLRDTAGKGPIRKLIIYGVNSHPTVPDVDMQEGYVFILDKDEYHCIDIIKTFGETQGIWEAYG